jgi:hypothetical protein
MSIIEGWIDEVENDTVFGRLVIDGQELEFWVPLLMVMESQRVDLEPGRYVYLVNGELMIDGAIWTTHDMEQADAEAKRLHAALHFS